MQYGNSMSLRQCNHDHNHNHNQSKVFRTLGAIKIKIKGFQGILLWFATCFLILILLEEVESSAECRVETLHEVWYKGSDLREKCQQPHSVIHNLKQIYLIFIMQCLLN
jgi:hypothetical protein